MCFIKHHFDLISRPVSAMCTLHNEKPKSKHKCYCFNGRLQPDVKVSALGNNFRNTHNSNAKETEKFCFTLFTLTPIFCPLQKKKMFFLFGHYRMLQYLFHTHRPQQRLARLTTRVKLRPYVRFFLTAFPFFSGGSVDKLYTTHRWRWGETKFAQSRVAHQCIKLH